MKTLGQIAWAERQRQLQVIPLSTGWANLYEDQRESWEAIAKAVAQEVARRAKRNPAYLDAFLEPVREELRTPWPDPR